MKKQFDVVCEDILKDTRKKQLIDEDILKKLWTKASKKLNSWGNAMDNDDDVINNFNTRFEDAMTEYGFKEAGEDKGFRVWQRIYKKQDGTEFTLKVKLGSFLSKTSEEDEVDADEAGYNEFAQFKVFVNGKGLKTKISIDEGETGIKEKVARLLGNKGININKIANTEAKIKKENEKAEKKAEKARKKAENANKPGLLTRIKKKLSGQREGKGGDEQQPSPENKPPEGDDKDQQQSASENDNKDEKQNEQNLIKCPNCGKEFDGKTHKTFCPHCGKKY